MEEKVVRKTTAKRTTRKSVAPKGVTSRPGAVKRTAEISSVRKAPPRLASKSTTVTSRSPRKIKVVLLGTALFGVLFGVSALIGMSDKGQLDVSDAIAQRKQNATEEEKRALETVPTEQSKPALPNGGLVGMGAPEPAPQAPQPVASSSDESATTTKETEAPAQQDTSEEPPAEPTSDTALPQATDTSSTETAQA